MIGMEKLFILTILGACIVQNPPAVVADHTLSEARPAIDDQLTQADNDQTDNLQSDEAEGALTEGSTRERRAATSGAVYVRWGSSRCPSGSELVYTGTAAGSYYSHTGSGSNYLCLPNNPIYGEVAPGLNTYRAIVYSSEYQIYNDGPSRWRSRHDHTPPCAVCRAPGGRTSVLMVPARNQCPSRAWRREYHGYLMAERYNHKRSEYVCMDYSIEMEPGTGGDQNGALFYFVEARCLRGGGLPCAPYINGYELTCAVCTI